MRFTRHEIALAVEGRLIGQDGLVVGVTIDSREVFAGSLFVPIVAQRDGHDFIEAARRAGAGAWLSSRVSLDANLDSRTYSDDEDLTREGEIVVSDTTVALQKLGSYARKRMSPSVIGVTGSTGKTSTKDLIGGVLRTVGPAAVSEKSFNNELGVPLTLANAPDDSLHAVVEMGARGIGHIAMLCGIARPTVGVVTNIGTAHRELFGSAEATAHAKGELFESLPPSGTAVLNADDPMYPILRSKVKCSALTFSASGSTKADLIATDIVLSGDLLPTFSLSSPWGSATVSLNARGAHQVSNALAAAGASLSAGIGLDDVIRGLATDSLSRWRMEFHRVANGAIVLNDAYNANPASMKAALVSLAATSGTRRFAVLGTMAELGDDAESMHREVISFAEEVGVDIVVAVSETAYGVPAVDGIEGALEFLRRAGFPREGDVVLVKGSRMAGLESLAEQLLALNPDGGPSRQPTREAGA